MPQVLTPLVESIADTGLIVRTVKFIADGTITLGTLIICDATAGAIALELPSAGVNEGRVLIIKKKDVSVNAVTVTRVGSDTIDGATTYVLTSQYDSVILVNDEDGDIWNVTATV